MKVLIKRRDFISWFGTSLISCLAFSNVAKAITKDEFIYASAYMEKGLGYGVAMIDKNGQILKKYRLPGRGHSFAASKNSHWLVTFARRPGNFALAIDRFKQKPPIIFKTPFHTHFYGHGVFSQDGKILFATENEFDNSGKGVVGVYDATDKFRRIGQFDSHGTGPHELVLMKDKKTLCIANGGILTHPDNARTKLNLHNMQSSVVFVDSQHGDLLTKLNVPSSLKRLSMRHMAVDKNNNVWIGAQYQGYSETQVPLISVASLDEGLVLLNFGKGQKPNFANYIGSVATNEKGTQVAFTSPKSSRLVVIEVSSKKIRTQQKIKNVCGVSALKDKFITSSLSGKIQGKTTDLKWDNHLTALKHS